MHHVALPAWALERGKRMNHFPSIEAKRAAFLAVDLQNAFTREGDVFGNEHARDIIPNVNRLAGAMRKAGGHVIWTRQTISSEPGHAHPKWQFNVNDPAIRRAMDALRPGAMGHALNSDLDVSASDLVVDKYRYSAFIQHASDIDERLRTLGIDTLIVAGTLTNVCCESTARDAYMLGYRILFAADATAAATDEEHNAALLNLCLNFADVRGTEALIALVAQSSR